MYALHGLKVQADQPSYLLLAGTLSILVFLVFRFFAFLSAFRNSLETSFFNAPFSICSALYAIIRIQV